MSTEIEYLLTEVSKIESDIRIKEAQIKALRITRRKHLQKVYNLKKKLGLDN